MLEESAQSYQRIIIAKHVLLNYYSYLKKTQKDTFDKLSSHFIQKVQWFYLNMLSFGQKYWFLGHLTVRQKVNIC